MNRQGKKRATPHHPLFSPSAMRLDSPSQLPGAFSAHPNNMPVPAKEDQAHRAEAPAGSVNYLLDYFVLRAPQSQTSSALPDAPFSYYLPDDAHCTF